MSDKVEFVLPLSSGEVSAIQSALHREAGELAASEVRRTGGRGFASGGISRQVQVLLDLQDRLSWWRIKTYEWRRDPGTGIDYCQVGSEELNHVYAPVTDTRSHKNRIRISKARFSSDFMKWHDWEIVPHEDKPIERPL